MFDIKKDAAMASLV